MSRSPTVAGTGAPSSATEDYVAGWTATMDLVREGRSFSGRERNRAFLGTPGGRFADVSAATGLDHADDGRALAVVDWDEDGDLDLWLHNRTGPRLRLLQNRSEGTAAGRADWVALELVGTGANRDAVGARVEVELAGATRAPGSRLVAAVSAGDAFLSQSSRRLHFGLGRGAAIERVSVRWPDGALETFEGVEPGARYRLERGGHATRLPARAPSALRGEAPPEPERTQRARIALPVHVPLPTLPYAPFEGGEPRAIEPGRARLVNFWASWCAPCLAELRELAARSDELSAAGIEVLALSVDALDAEHGTGPEDAARTLARLGVPFSAGAATAELLEKLDALQRVLFDAPEPFAVPTSVLLDARGALAGIYRGPVGVEALLEDAAELDATPRRLHERSTPFPGRWNNLRLAPDHGALAAAFLERWPEDAARYLALAEAAGGAGGQLASLEADLCVTRATTAREARRFDEAREVLERALELSPDHAGASFELGNLLRLQGDWTGAERAYRHTLAQRPDQAEAHTNLGIVLANRGLLEEAIACFRRALELDPARASVHQNLGNALFAVGAVDPAITCFENALRLDPEYTKARESLERARSGR